MNYSGIFAHILPLSRSGPLLVALFLITGCDHGLVPPDVPPTGTIRAAIEYVGVWPPESEFRDLRFVAMRFVPRDTADFLQLNRMVISDRLDYNVLTQDVEISEVETGVFLYTGIAQQFSSDLLSWRPLGLYKENDGVFFVTKNETTDVSILVDFAERPPFPPPEF
ncbi:MAG: hypothetical protein BMS9Abin05_2615 [Rhodothermia bacterium]|nr:MAG: hypothetical protein BMS9Abin05_2615 [Rhodothermia bacterium]